MTTAKDTLDQYNETRAEGREKLQPLFDEKNKRRATIKEVLMGIIKKKESKEKMKAPKLESKNYKLDKGKSKQKKLAEGWEEEKINAYINGFETTIKVLRKELAPGAFVREYEEECSKFESDAVSKYFDYLKMPKYLIGEQLFNWEAVLYLGLKDRLPTWENMVAMRGETEKQKDNFLKNNFQEDGKNVFPGYFDPTLKIFKDINESIEYLLADGDTLEINKRKMIHDCGNHPDYRIGSSLRLLKK